VTTLQKVNTY